MEDAGGEACRPIDINDDPGDAFIDAETNADHLQNATWLGDGEERSGHQQDDEKRQPKNDERPSSGAARWWTARDGHQDAAPAAAGGTERPLCLGAGRAAPSWMRDSVCHPHSACQPASMGHDVLNMLGGRSMRSVGVLTLLTRSAGGEITQCVLSGNGPGGATVRPPDGKNDGHALLLRKGSSWLQLPIHSAVDYRIVATNDNDYSRRMARVAP